MRQTNSSFTTTPFSSTPFASSSTLRVASSPALPNSRTLASAAVYPRLDTGGFDPASVSLSRLQALLDICDRYLRLPNNPRAFSLYLAALILVSAGATLYVSLSAQILQAEVQLTRGKETLATIEQENGDLLWKIARETNMNNLQERIAALGYVPVQEREYVVLAGDAAPLAAAAQPEPAAPVSLALSPAPDAQRPAAAWHTFFSTRWRAAPAATLTASQVSLPAASDNDLAADQWRRWWEQTLARGASYVQQFTGR